jgi:cold shock protein
MRPAGDESLITTTTGKSSMLLFGTLKTYFAEKGYGFIKPDQEGRDVFAHIKAFEESGITNPTVGQRYSFETQLDPRSGRPRAVNLKAA